MMLSSPSSTQPLISNQKQQAWLRILFVSLSGLYVALHGRFFEAYQATFLALLCVFILWQAYVLVNISQRPISMFRTLTSPIADSLLISFAILVDGGQSSGLFLLYLLTIMGNGMRFGNPMLVYSQVWAAIGFLTLCIFTYIDVHFRVDLSLFIFQILALIILPTYIYVSNKHSSKTFKAKESAEKLSFGLLDRSPLPVFTFQQDQKNKQNPPRISYANQTMQQVYRDDIINLIGEQVDVLALMEDGQEMIKACQQLFTKASSEPHRFYIRGRNKQDKTLQLMGQANLIQSHGKSVGMCFLVDISQNEAMHSEMQQSMQDGYMGTLVAGIVHDFRNVLTGIIGSAEVLQFSTKDQAVIDKLELIITAGERGSEMISNLLTLAKSDHHEDITDSGLMYQSITSIIGLLRIQLPGHIQLQLDIEELLPTVSINLTQLEQLIMNLVNNATQAMPNPGTIHVQLRANFQHPLALKRCPALQILVADDGTGIKPEDLEKITKPFWTSRNDEGGTGLGLAMVQRIVRNHGGELDIQSTLGQGTTIAITFPPKQNAKKDQISKAISSDSASEEVDTSFQLQPWKILLVDDSPDVLHVHEHLLKRLNQNITTAENAKNALELWQESFENNEPFQLVITDFRMPGMDGIDLCRAIRKQDAHLPLLIITAYGEAEKLQTSLEVAIEILAKPASFKKLEAKLTAIQQRYKS